jgi:type II secretory pathway component PulJ
MNKSKNAGYTVLEFMIANTLAIPLVLILTQVLSSTHLLLLDSYERKRQTIGSLAV